MIGQAFIRCRGLTGWMVMALIGCSSGSSKQGADPAPVAITVTLASATIEVGATTQATAVVRDEAGNVLSGRSVSWSASDDRIVSVDPAGLVTGVAAGSATITATSEGRSGSAIVTVAARPRLQIARSAGDAQTAARGAAVAVAPQVLVTDSTGRPASGVAVTFAITSGGGTLQAAQAVTGADGKASCGGWTLGSTLGVQGMSASIDGGTVTFEATATDVVSALPVVTVSSPMAETVARPSLVISAACTDDAPGGCTSLAVLVDGVVLLSGTSTLAADVDLSAYDGRGIDLTFTGTDADGQTATVKRRVYVELSPKLELQVSVPGRVWDVSGTRVLYVDRSAALPVLRIRDLSADTTQDVDTGDSLAHFLEYGFLTPSGAIYLHHEGSVPCVYEWRRGARTKLASMESDAELKVGGSNAIYSEAAGLVRRELVSGTNTTVARGVGIVDDDVAANGDVVYWSLDEDVYRFRDGSTTRLSSHAATDKTSGRPLTDGASTVYQSCTYVNSLLVCDTILHDGTSGRTLAPGVEYQEPNKDYAINGGHVAYTKADAADAPQLWRHTAAGETQLTSFPSPSTIAALSPDGTVLLDNGGRRYRAAPGADLEDVGAALGRAMARDGKFYVIVGNTVFSLPSW